MASRIDKDARSEAAKHHALAITTRELKQMDEGDDMKITTESIQNLLLDEKLNYPPATTHTGPLSAPQNIYEARWI